MQNNMNMENKSLLSLSIKPLYTNIPVKKCIKRLEIHLNYLINFIYSPNNKNLNVMS